MKNTHRYMKKQNKRMIFFMFGKKKRCLKLTSERNVACGNENLEVLFVLRTLKVFGHAIFW